MYFPCSENKGADQLRGYREADLRLCFRICKNPVFSRQGSNNTAKLWANSTLNEKEIQSTQHSVPYLYRFRNRFFGCPRTFPEREQRMLINLSKKTRGAWWLSGRASDSGVRGHGFETYLRLVVSLSPESTGNTQEAVALYQHDLKNY